MEVAVLVPTPPGHALDGELAGVLLRTLNDLGDGVVILEGDRFVWVNDAFQRMTGYLHGELTGPEFHLRYIFPPDEQPRMDERIRLRLSGAVPEDHYETRILRLNGERREVEVSVKPLHIPGRSYRFAIIRDITSRKREAEELEVARKERAKAEKMAALGSLVSGVAHEVRTPLAYIANNIHVVDRRLRRASAGELDPAKVVEEVGPCVAAAQEGVDRINRLVKDLHRYTKLPESDSRPTFLEDLVREAIELWRDTHPGLGVSIVEQIEPTMLMRLDVSKLQQVVLNLLENGAEAMPHGGIIHVTTEAIPDGARLLVRDEGEGIAPDRLGKIFEPLFTTKPEGMGLGLAIVRRIVELHKGSIQCHSSEGTGTTFIVTLPRDGL